MKIMFVPFRLFRTEVKKYFAELLERLLDPKSGRRGRALSPGQEVGDAGEHADGGLRPDGAKHLGKGRKLTTGLQTCTGHLRITTIFLVHMTTNIRIANH